MGWDAMFKSANITKCNNCYVLSVTYSYYWLYNYNLIFVFSTIEEAKNKLIALRCHDNIQIVEEIIEKSA